jgi:ATP-binding cassette subfamily B protein
MAGDELGGYEDVREEVDGHPMVGLLRYARDYLPRLPVGVFASLRTRLSRLVPPLVVGAAMDHVINQSANPGLLADLGLETATTEAERS